MHGEMTVAEAGRLGGAAVKEKYGVEHYQRIGQLGGAVVSRERGSEFYAEIGRKGGNANMQRHGSEFYAAIGQKGGESVKANHDAGYYSRIGQMGGERRGPRTVSVGLGVVGGMLRAARINAGLTQAELGARVGTCQAVISIFETGRRSLGAYREPLALVLGLDPETLAENPVGQSAPKHWKNALATL